MAIIKVAFDLQFGEGKEPFKLEGDLASSINVMVGQNGSGKTMYLICTWFINYMMQIYQTSLMAFPEEADNIFVKTANTVIKLTFNGYQNMCGILTYTGECSPGGAKYTFILQVKDGEVVHFLAELESPEDFAQISLQSPIFNSKDARSFDDYERYLKTVRMIGIPEGGFKDIKDLEKLGDLYKMFDIQWFERVRVRMNDWDKSGLSQYAEKFLTDFHTNYPSDTDAFGTKPTLVLREGIPYIKSDTVDKKISDFSSGHQAVLMTQLFL